MSKRTIAGVAAACMALCFAGPTGARTQFPEYQAWIGGVPLTCSNWQGIPVQIIANPHLNDVGVAHSNANGQPIIQLNPNVMNRYSILVQAWWFAHECGHHALLPYQNSETNADCWGIRVMRDQGLIRWQWELNAFANELANLPGSSSGHLPGPMRAANIAHCALT